MFSHAGSFHLTNKKTLTTNRKTSKNFANLHRRKVANSCFDASRIRLRTRYALVEKNFFYVLVHFSLSFSSSEPKKQFGTPSQSFDNSNNCKTSVDSFT